MTVTANTAWDLRGANFTSTVVKGTGWYSWDVLSLIKEGETGLIPSVMLCAANTTDKAKEFASFQNSTVASRPYATVNYNIPIQYLVVDSSSITPLHPGGTLKPKVLYFPENATDTALTYSSDNSNVATVN